MLDFHPETLKRLLDFKQSDTKSVDLPLLILLLESKSTFIDVNALYYKIYEFKLRRSNKKKEIPILRALINDNFCIKTFKPIEVPNNQKNSNELIGNDQVTESEKTMAVVQTGTFPPFRRVVTDDLLIITVNDDFKLSREFPDSPIPGLIKYTRQIKKREFLQRHKNKISQVNPPNEETKEDEPAVSPIVSQTNEIRANKTENIRTNQLETVRANQPERIFFLTKKLTKAHRMKV